MPSRLRTSLLVLCCSTAVALLAPAAGQAAPGAVDPAYGNGGYAAASTPRLLSLGGRSAMQPDGKLLVSGATTSFPLWDRDDRREISLSARVHPVVYRYLANGQLDTSFGAGGRAALYVDNHLSGVTDITVLDSGAIVVVGTSFGFLSSSTFIARLEADGSVDRTFGANGYRTLLPKRFDALVPVAVEELSSGALHVVANSFSANFDQLFGYEDMGGMRDTDVVQLRFTPDGSLDRTFDGDGIAQFDLTGTESIDLAADAVVDGADRVTVAGVAYGGRKSERSRALVVRFAPNGRRDSTFGPGGVAPQPSRAGLYEAATAIERLADGTFKIGVRRHRAIDRARDEHGYYVRRIGAGGRGLPWGGSTVGARIPGYVVPASILTLPNRRTLVAGAGSRWDDEPGFESGVMGAVSSLTANGFPDASFDRGGVSHLGRSGDDDRPSVAFGLHRAPLGKVLVSGTFDGHAGAARIYGSSALGASTRSVNISRRIGLPRGIRGCGTTLRAPCVVHVWGRGPLTLDVATRGVPRGQRLWWVTEEQAWRNHWYSWGDDRSKALDSRGRATIQLRQLRLWSATYRIRLHVGATRTTRSAIGMPMYIRIARHYRHGGGGPFIPAPGIDPATEVQVSSSRSFCDHTFTGSGALRANVAAYCGSKPQSVRRSSRSGAEAVGRMLRG